LPTAQRGPAAKLLASVHIPKPNGLVPAERDKFPAVGFGGASAEAFGEFHRVLFSLLIVIPGQNRRDFILMMWTKKILGDGEAPRSVRMVDESKAGSPRWRTIAGWLAVLAAVVAAPSLNSRLAHFLESRGFVARGGPAVAEPAVPPEDLNLVLLEESFRADSPRTVFYTWRGSDSLEDVELTVKVESGGSRLQVRQSWATWHSGETKAVHLPSKADWLLPPVLSGSAVHKGQKCRLAARWPAE
jgi:hypothetical protein